MVTLYLKVELRPYQLYVRKMYPDQLSLSVIEKGILINTYLSSLNDQNYKSVIFQALRKIREFEISLTITVDFDLQIIVDSS